VLYDLEVEFKTSDWILHGWWELENRTISDCRIQEIPPIGLPPDQNWTLAWDQKQVGSIMFERKKFFLDGELRFIDYLITFDRGYVVYLGEQVESCIRAAEEILATVRILE
jgi:hypothetical protein